MKRTPAQQLNLLREHRVYRDRAAPIGPIAAAIAGELKQLERKIGGVAGAWAETCPADIADRTSVESISRGVLHIRADDASTRYIIDRWLRSGGERELIRKCPTTVRKVKVAIAPSADTRSGR
ncbi:MAG: DUF721 domain-containing protein [Phycisphaerae bacterium]|nr:DUF721 domain-containing protein [Phycisphaerae bacterium]